MNCMRLLFGVSLVVCFAVSIEQAAAENYPVVLRGKVVMADGTPPPFTAGLERICSDDNGSKPGPLTNKMGEYLWRMDVDPMRSRACFIRATHVGYVSTSIDISALNGYLTPNINLEPIMLTSLIADPYAIIISDSNVPLPAKSGVKAAMKALDANNIPEARRRFQAAVQAAPKFAPGWHALGVVLERDNAMKEAREAYEHAIESNPKMLPPYMTLVRLCIRSKDWECAAKNADDLLKADKKQLYRDTHLHRAVALYGLKDLDRAAESAREALAPSNGTPRAEYVYGRILEAKGDFSGAREHMSRYLELDKNAPDSELIRQHLQNLGKAETAGSEPELEYP